jgi:hypothetical protein
MAGTTFIARLKQAPFPYDGRFADQRRPFFDTQLGRQRAHTTGDGKVYAERPHYSEDRVLFHLPPGFDANKPFAIVVFFHGHNGELRRTVLGQLRIAQQIDLARRNVVLIAPQLARDAADSAAGKLFRRNGLKRLLAEAAGVLAQRCDIPPSNFSRAPILLAAYSGGYRSVAFALDRGGVAARIKSVVLLDAVYCEEDKLAAGLAARNAVVLGGPSTRKGHQALQRRLEAAGCRIYRDWPAGRAAPGLVFKLTKSSHARLPLLGPPRWPLAWAVGAFFPQ